MNTNRGGQYRANMVAALDEALAAWWAAAEYETCMYATELAEYKALHPMPTLKAMMIEHKASRIAAEAAELARVAAAKLEVRNIAILESYLLADEAELEDNSISLAAEAAWQDAELAALEVVEAAEEILETAAPVIAAELILEAATVAAGAELKLTGSAACLLTPAMSGLSHDLRHLDSRGPPMSTTHRRGGSYTRNGRTYSRRGGTVHYSGRTRTGGAYSVSGYGPTSAIFGARAARWAGKRALRGVARWWRWVRTPDGPR